MKTHSISRRGFLGRSAAASAVLALGPACLTEAVSAKPSAVDLVPLGKTGVKICRLGLGTGTRGGSVQRALGREGFTRLVRFAYDQGITYIDTAQAYRTHDLVREAIKGLPREKLFIQTKIPGRPEKPLEVIDRYRKELDTDYLDSLLVHCAVTHNWDEERRRVVDAVLEAHSRKWIRLKGVSCHSLPALRRATELDWIDVHLVRINPQGSHLDTPVERWNAPSDASHVQPVVQQIRRMQQEGRGIIGMKIIGEGAFTQPGERERSIRFTLRNRLADSLVIGFKSEAEIREAIERMNRALAVPA